MISISRFGVIPKYITAGSFGLYFKPRYLVYWGLPDKSPSFLILCNSLTLARKTEIEETHSILIKKFVFESKKKKKTNGVR